MNVVVMIQGREAIPVRAIPLLTDWNSMTPDCLAGVLAEDDAYFDFEGLKAYYVEAGLVHRLEATWWESYCCRALKECSDNIKITHPELKTHSQWKRESLPLLPAGVFVWKDEYEALHEKSWRLRDYWRTRISPGESEDDQKPLLDRLSLADDRYVREKLNKWRKLNFSPRAQDSGIEHLVMDGFEPEQATAEPQAAPVVADSAPGGVELVTGKRWTPENLAELKSYREKHGTKKAAEHFCISESLIRQKLPSEKPQPKGYSAFTHRIK